MADQLPSLGDRIRDVRMSRGLSLRALAAEVGVSASMISQIENGKSQPSVSTLYAITSALGMSIQSVFDAAETVERAVGSPATVLSALGAFRGQRIVQVVRGSERLSIHLGTRRA